MEDLNEKLTRLLSSPEGMERIQSMMAALGGALPQEEPPPPVAPPPPTATAVADSGIDVATLTRLLPLIRNLNQENEDTKLLSALRPYLHGQRAERLEESMRLLRLMQLLPLLTEGGKHGGG